MKIKGKVAIVTGAARGIGRATAIEMARNGADVVVSEAHHLDEATQLVRHIESLGRRALVFKGDVADRAQDQALVETAVRDLGGVDILVCNAAHSSRKSLLELEVEEVERTWAVIMWGVFHCSQFAARQMVKQGRGGNIVVISSVHASVPYQNASPYNGAKAAVSHMARTWAAELAPFRIRVNVIEPGWIDTPGERAAFSGEEISKWAQELPFGRLGRPEEIAKAVAFVVSEEDASYLTGSCLRVDGGYVLPR
jgi:glucose 1-dehydrogenase